MGVATAQEAKKRVAVYITGEVDAGYKKVIGSKLVSGITNSEGYTAVERTAEFLAELNKDVEFSVSGAVRDNQIAKIGQMFGVHYVLVAEISEVFDEMFVSSRMIDVNTAAVKASFEASKAVESMNDLMTLANNIVGGVLKIKISGQSSYQSPSSQGQDVETITVKGVTFNMIKVVGGTFTMGATSEQGGEADSDEYPTHSVTLSDYYIGETEVTQELWEAVMGNNPSNFKGDRNLPVEMVSWQDCQLFIERLNRLTGKYFRLPTEAEWEYAARGGNKSQYYKYAGSTYADDVAWYDGNSGSRTHIVKGKRPNELGLFDMSGNVWEWCSDWFGSYSAAPQSNPRGAGSGGYRVLRGGSWSSYAWNVRVSNRNNFTPGSRNSYLGLRLAL